MHGERKRKLNRVQVAKRRKKDWGIIKRRNRGEKSDYVRTVQVEARFYHEGGETADPKRKAQSNRWDYQTKEAADFESPGKIGAKKSQGIPPGSEISKDAGPNPRTNGWVEKGNEQSQDGPSLRGRTKGGLALSSRFHLGQEETFKNPTTIFRQAMVIRPEKMGKKKKSGPKHSPRVKGEMKPSKEEKNDVAHLILNIKKGSRNIQSWLRMDSLLHRTNRGGKRSGVERYTCRKPDN